MNLPRRAIADIAGGKPFFRSIVETHSHAGNIERVARGEIWLDRATTAKLLADLTGSAKAKQEDPKDAAIAALTRKERDIIVAVLQHKGAPIKVIAATLCLSSHTVRNHLAAIYCKLDVHSRVDLFMYAKERGLDRHAA
jgi:DNA-binding NarL/FixJ family response regulator